MYGNRNLRHGCICGQCYKYTEIIKTKRLSAGGKTDDKSLAAELNPGRIGQSSLNKLSPNLCVSKIDLNAANGKQSNSGGKNGLSDITNTLQNISNAKQNNKPFSFKPAAAVEKPNKNNKDGISPAAKEKKVTFAPKIMACADAQITRKRYFYTKSEDLKTVVAKYREERLLRKEKSAQSAKVANLEPSGIGGEVSKFKSFFQPLLSAGAQSVPDAEKGNAESLPKSPSNKDDKLEQKTMVSSLEIPAQTIFTAVMDESPTEIIPLGVSPKETAVVLPPITKSLTHGEIEQSVSIQQNQQESTDVLIIKSTVTLGKESPISIETTLKSENLSVKRDSVNNTSADGMLKLEGHPSAMDKSNENPATAMVVSTEVFDRRKSSISQEDLALRRKSSVTMSIPVLEEKLISIFGTGNHVEHNKIETSTNAPADDKNPEKAESTSGYTPEETLSNEPAIGEDFEVSPQSPESSDMELTQIDKAAVSDDIEISPQNPESTDMELTQIDKTISNEDIKKSPQDSDSSDMDITPNDKTKTSINLFGTRNLSPKSKLNNQLPAEDVTDELDTSQHIDHTSALQKVAYPSPDSQAPAYLTLLAGRRSIGIQTAISQPRPPLILLPMVNFVNAFRETDEYKNAMKALFGTDIIDNELFETVLNPMCWSLLIILVFIGLIFGMMRKLLYFLFDLF